MLATFIAAFAGSLFAVGIGLVIVGYHAQKMIQSVKENPFELLG